MLFRVCYGLKDNAKFFNEKRMSLETNGASRDCRENAAGKRSRDPSFDGSGPVEEFCGRSVDGSHLAERPGLLHLADSSVSYAPVNPGQYRGLTGSSKELTPEMIA